MRQPVFSRLFSSRLALITRRYVNLWIVVGAALAAAMSLVIGLHQSIWFDEAYSILLAKHSFGQLIALTSLDTHPPLYYMLLKVWAGVFGWSELALRGLSVTALFGAVLVGGLLVKRLFGARVSLVAVLVMVMSPFMLRYGFEIRMYALASLIGIAATYVLITAQDTKAVAQRWWRYGLYAALVVLGVYTLYYLVLLWLAHGVWLIWTTWRKDRSLVKLVREPWVAAYGVSILLFAPWLPTVAYQLSHSALTSVTQALTLENLMSIVSFFTVYQPAWRLTPLLSLVVLLAIVALVWLSLRAFQVVRGEQRDALALLGLYLLVPVAALALICLHRPMYMERYLAHVAIGASLFVGVAIGLVFPRASVRGKSLIVALVLVLGIGIAQLSVMGNYNFQRLFYPPFRSVARSTTCGDGQMTLAADPMVAMELTYYMPSCPIHFYSSTADLTGGYAPLSHSPLLVNDIPRAVAGAKELTYVYYDQPQLEMPATFKLTGRTQYGALTVDRFSAE